VPIVIMFPRVFPTLGHFRTESPARSKGVSLDFNSRRLIGKAEVLEGYGIPRLKIGGIDERRRGL
jgi:hypothetical protein